MNKKSRLILVDGSAYIFRAYYGLPPMNRPDGTPIKYQNLRGNHDLSQQNMSNYTNSTIRKLQNCKRPVPSDIEISQAIEPIHIEKVALANGILKEEIDLFDINFQI